MDNDLKVIVCDLENTLTNASHRMHLLGKDDKKFQNEFIFDKPNNNVILFLESLKKVEDTRVSVTSKHEKYKHLATLWLDHYNVACDALIMMPDTNVDGNAFKEKYIKTNASRIIFGLDDVGEICKIYSKYNLPCLRIEQK